MENPHCFKFDLRVTPTSYRANSSSLSNPKPFVPFASFPPQLLQAKHTLSSPPPSSRPQPQAINYIPTFCDTTILDLLRF
ncbi:hypothetical protein CISIN_1g047799mg [Citrus sinensis]|uniref:Uncharacterized protein n=1 Tax=Citrus sinensis TaxID=2711 RepID=A0A067FPC1_CITSI|nr:hypothetical protein CISIN_1g047799mg [Citrus sinensis]